MTSVRALRRRHALASTWSSPRSTPKPPSSRIRTFDIPIQPIPPGRPGGGVGPLTDHCVRSVGDPLIGGYLDAARAPAPPLAERRRVAPLGLAANPACGPSMARSGARLFRPAYVLHVEVPDRPGPFRHDDDCADHDTVRSVVPNHEPPSLGWRAPSACGEVLENEGRQPRTRGVRRYKRIRGVRTCRRAGSAAALLAGEPDDHASERTEGRDNHATSVAGWSARGVPHHRCSLSVARLAVRAAEVGSLRLTVVGRPLHRHRTAGSAGTVGWWVAPAMGCHAHYAR